MRILFDQGTPVPLRRFLEGHQVDTAAERGWSPTWETGHSWNGPRRKTTTSSLTTDRNIRH